MKTLIIADESVDFAIIHALRQKEYLVTSIAESHSGWPDEQVLNFAFDQQAYLITEDKDFGELTFRLQKPSYGILLIRMADADSQGKATLVLTILEQHFPELWQAFTVLEASKLRIKPLHIPNK